MFADPPELQSLALACTLCSLFLAAVMVSIRNPWVETRGASWFAGAALVSAFSFVLVAFPPPVEFVLLLALRAANTVLIFGLIVGGICHFVGRPVPWLTLALSMTFTALVVLLFPSSSQDVTPRVLTIGLMLVGWALGGVWLLWRHAIPGLPRRGPWITTLGLLLLALTAALRSILLLSQGPVSGEEALSAPVNAWALLGGFGALLLTLTGVALMLNARMVQELIRWNSHDALTGAYNRRGFNAKWPDWLHAHGPGHVVLMDLNASDGSKPPEPALLVLVHALRSLLPSQALLARQGGNSFLLALPQSINPEQAEAWCAQLQEEVAQRLMLLMGGRGSHLLTLSLGHAMVHNTLAEAARRATMAMTGASSNPLRAS
jgi:GGDEF domain-containing protein